jgi:hypothetical protein
LALEESESQKVHAKLSEPVTKETAFIPDITLGL